MKKRDIAKFVALILLKGLLHLPSALMKKVGFGFTKEFEIGGRLITRPQHFNTKAHKAAFEKVGNYIIDVLTRDVMLVFRQSSINNDKFWGYKKMASNEIWNEVLSFFEKEKCIRHYWVLGLPDYKEIIQFYNSPCWGPDGEDLKRPKSGAISGVIPDTTDFNPSLLTDDQRHQLLIRGCYAKHPTSLVQNSFYKEQVLVPLSEDNFEKVYYRDRSVLSDENIEKGAKVLHTILKASQK